MPAVDINRTTSNVALPQEVSAEIWANVLEESAFMQLARRITIPGTGVTVQTITGEPVADWVDETAAKPVGTHTFGKKSIKPYKLAVIEPFSNEFKRDKMALYIECVNRLPKALGTKFDGTIMSDTPPGTGFDVLGGAQKVSLNPGADKTVYDRFLEADSLISDADGVMNGIALAPKGKSKVLSAVDGQKRPLFTPGVGSNTVGDILGAPVHVNKGVYVAASGADPAVVGVAGDFSDSVWGSVEGIQMSVSDQASLEIEGSIVNLWQQNMFAVRFEIEVAFAVKSLAEFVLLTGDVAGA